MADALPQLGTTSVSDDHDEGTPLSVYATRDAERFKKLPSPEKVFLTVTEAAAVLNTTPYRLRTAIRKGHIRSKRRTKSPRAMFLIHREWLEEYRRFLDAPTLGMKIKAWFRRTF